MEEEVAAIVKRPPVKPPRTNDEACLYRSSSIHLARDWASGVALTTPKASSWLALGGRQRGSGVGGGGRMHRSRSRGR